MNSSLRSPDDASADAIHTFPDGPLPLAILGQPKPQQARFYLGNADGHAQPDGAPKEEVAYKAGKRLRGRKVYPHHRNLPADYWRDDSLDHTQDPPLGGHFQEYRRPVIQEIRKRDLAVLAHASPQPHRYIAFTGVDVPRAHELFDGLVVNCWRNLDALEQTRGAAVPVHASFLAVEGMGGRPDTLAEQGLAARAAGATGIRLYHAGLAGTGDLDGIRELTSKGADR